MKIVIQLVMVVLLAFNAVGGVADDGDKINCCIKGCGS